MTRTIQIGLGLLAVVGATALSRSGTSGSLGDVDLRRIKIQRKCGYFPKNDWSLDVEDIKFPESMVGSNKDEKYLVRMWLRNPEGPQWGHERLRIAPWYKSTRRLKNKGVHRYTASAIHSIRERARESADFSREILRDVSLLSHAPITLETIKALDDMGYQPYVRELIPLDLQVDHVGESWARYWASHFDKHPESEKTYLDHASKFLIANTITRFENEMVTGEAKDHLELRESLESWGKVLCALDPYFQALQEHCHVPGHPHLKEGCSSKPLPWKALRERFGTMSFHGCR